MLGDDSAVAFEPCKQLGRRKSVSVCAFDMLGGFDRQAGRPGRFQAMQGNKRATNTTVEKGFKTRAFWLVGANRLVGGFDRREIALVERNSMRTRRVGKLPKNAVVLFKKSGDLKIGYFARLGRRQPVERQRELNVNDRANMARLATSPLKSYPPNLVVTEDELNQPVSRPDEGAIGSICVRMVVCVFPNASILRRARVSLAKKWEYSANILSVQFTHKALS